MKINAVFIELTPYRYSYTDDIELRITVRTGGQVHNTQAVLSPDDFRSNYDMIMSKLTETLREHITDA